MEWVMAVRPYLMAGWDPMTQWAPYLTQLLRTLETAIIWSELLHALHVQALRNPELAREPAMERFGRESLNLLHAQVAAAGLVRRLLMGEVSQELLRLLGDQMRTMQRSLAETSRALRELAARPPAAQVMPLEAMRTVLGQAAQVQRAAVSYGQSLLGVLSDPMGLEDEDGNG